MAWIESHENLGEHPKVYELCTSLNVDKPMVIGVLHLLWHFTLKFAWRDGDLSRFSEQSIASAIGWKGDAKALFDALKSSGWLDEMVIHDWMDYAGKIVRDRLYNEDKRKTSKIAVLRRITPNNSLTLPNPTLPKYKDTTLSSKDDSTTPVKIETNGKGPTPEQLVVLWNSKAHPNLPKVEMLTPKRKIHINARLKDHPEKTFWDALIERVNNAPHLRGENDRNWKCNFDWILNVNNMAKILEGNYDPHKRTN